LNNLLALEDLLKDPLLPLPFHENPLPFIESLLLSLPFDRDLAKFPDRNLLIGTLLVADTILLESLLPLSFNEDPLLPLPFDNDPLVKSLLPLPFDFDPFLLFGNHFSTIHCHCSWMKLSILSCCSTNHFWMNHSL